MRLLFLSMILVSCAHQPPAAPPPPIDQAALEQSAAEHNHDVLLCYEDMLKTKYRVNDKLNGDLRLSFDTDSSGNVQTVRLVQGVEKKFDSCAIQKAKAWKYPWLRKSTAEMEDSFHVYLTPEGQPMSEFKGPQLRKASVRTVIHDHFVEVRKCYEDRLLDVPGLKGELVVEWDLDPEGNVHGAHAYKSLDHEVDRCIIGKLKTWNFPAPENTMAAKIRLPFDFKTQ